MTACLFDKETTNYDDIRKMHSVVGNVVNKILKSGVLRNCTFQVQRESVLIQALRNSSCHQQKPEVDDSPLCTGHGYGLIKCSKGN
jgi:hypothetical protein